jgi:hypothetical protein
MKNAKNAKSRADATLPTQSAKAVEAERQVKAARKRARLAKAQLKRARKALKQAKKAAKLARKEAQAAARALKPRTNHTPKSSKRRAATD